MGVAMAGRMKKREISIISKRSVMEGRERG